MSQYSKEFKARIHKMKQKEESKSAKKKREYADYKSEVANTNYQSSKP